VKEFRGLRLWLPLHLHGVSAFRNALDEKLDLAERAYRELSADQRLEFPCKPDRTVVTFRLRNASDEDNRRFLKRINETRKIFLSSTQINGRFTLRLCVLSHRTHSDHLTDALETIRAAIGAPALSRRLELSSER
jgi:aromatic-L-amino-acid decarboxylase